MGLINMTDIIDPLFQFCCFTITEIGHLFSLSYEAINVIAFCYVEPIFTGIMVIFAILALFSVLVSRIGKIIFWIVCGCVIILLMYGAIKAFNDIVVYQNDLSRFLSVVSIKETNPLVIKQFNGGVNWLYELSNIFNTSYEMVNLIVYVFGMPTISLFSFIIIVIKGRAARKN